MTSSIHLTGAGEKESRRALDFYPTPPDVTHALMQFLQTEGITPEKVWEPACGRGDMSMVIEKYVDEVYSSDIRTDMYGDDGVDFLSTTVDGMDAIITNPPFALSEQFIRHSLSQAGMVAMLLKSQYWHAASRYALFSQYPPAFVLALTWRPDFLFDQRLATDKRAAPTMECQWTVWVSGDTDTKYRVLRKPAITETNKRTNP